MKSISILFLALLINISLSGQSPVGAWESIYENDQGEKVKMVVIFSENYQVATHYKLESGAFIMTNGGSWKLSGNHMTEVVEFDSANPDRVGSKVEFDITAANDQMSIVGHDIILKRIDSGAPGALKGAWLMSGRKRNGEIQNRDTNQPRKTMKILSGTRFQWIAYNTKTKEFKGTGGGTYTTVNGTYTESIEFFSKDESRVGANLNFTFELVDSNWHHSGFSSKGDPLYEIWSLRK